MPAMHTVSRILIRAFSSGVQHQATLEPSDVLDPTARLVRALSTAIRESAGPARFQSVRCGFAKDLVGGPSTVLDADAYGDDACFVAHHPSADVVGVADGVGGWRSYGIDPGKFSRSLMAGCSELVRSGHFNPSLPSELLANAYHKIRMESDRSDADSDNPVGSSTACVVVLDRAKSLLYTANLGDSGFLVLRRGKVVHRSQEQCHYFNTPYQLSLPPDNVSNCLKDSPDSADESTFSVREGDLILVATDGLFDNLPIDFIEEQIRHLPDSSELALQSTVNSMALAARQLAFDSEYMSPFAKKAVQEGYRARGGKPDDVTVILAVVKAQSDAAPADDRLVPKS